MCRGSSQWIMWVNKLKWLLLRALVPVWILLFLREYLPKVWNENMKTKLAFIEIHDIDIIGNPLFSLYCIAVQQKRVSQSQFYNLPNINIYFFAEIFLDCCLRLQITLIFRYASTAIRNGHTSVRLCCCAG